MRTRASVPWFSEVMRLQLTKQPWVQAESSRAYLLLHKLVSRARESASEGEILHASDYLEGANVVLMSIAEQRGIQKLVLAADLDYQAELLNRHAVWVELRASKPCLDETEIDTVLGLAYNAIENARDAFWLGAYDASRAELTSLAAYTARMKRERGVIVSSRIPARELVVCK